MHRLFLITTVKKPEGKYSLESTDPRESEIRAHLRPSSCPVTYLLSQNYLRSRTVA